MTKTPWYIAGLHFKCTECGQCCSGPDEGYIWVTKPELKLMAAFLETGIDDFSKKYAKRVGVRTTIIEDQLTNDCIFLKRIDGKKKCAIYNVRPQQCRTWPFWSTNLSNPNAWNNAAQKCSGINRRRLHTYQQILKAKNSKKWWTDE